MHPADHKSAGIDQGFNPRMTSGGRYCRVQIVEDFFSLSYVAPPKSIILILVLAGTI